MDYAAIMRIPLLVMLFFMSLSVSAEVYRSVDEDGNVIFSDQPSPGAEEIKIDKIQTIDAPPVKPKPLDTGSEKSRDKNKEAYSKVAILTPTNDESISANDGNISVGVSVSPELQTKNGHQVVLFLDGNEVARSTSMKLDLTNLDRGTHTLAVAVMDEKGNEIKRSDTISFTVQRHSVQHPESTVGRPPAGTPPGPTGGQPGPAGGTPGPTGGAPSPAP